MTKTHTLNPRLIKFSYLLATVSLLVLNACGGGGGGGNGGSAGGGSTVTNLPASQIGTATIGSTGGTVVIDSNPLPIAVFQAGVVSSSAAVTATVSSNYSGLEENTTLDSKVVTVALDPNLITDGGNDSTVTIYLPPSGSQSGAQPGIQAKVQSGAAAGDIANTTPMVVKVKIGNNYSYMNAVTSQVRADAAAVITLSKNVFVMAGGAVEVALIKLQSTSTPDGKLFALSSVSASADISQTTQPMPTGKVPLVLVHGIQAACASEATAYKTTWTAFTKFFYESPDAAALRNRFQLYSFAYPTDQGIAGNGDKLRAQLLSVFGTTKVVVLAHSMGGLVARHADSTSAEGFQGLLTLNTPHHGTTNGIVSLGIGINALTKNLWANFDGLPIAITTQLGLHTQCTLALSATGARDLRWDYFDAAIPAERCSASTPNSFLCEDSTGLNRRAVPAKMYVYSSQRGSNADWKQKFSGWVLQNNSIENMLADDGDVPVASQQFQSYNDAIALLKDRYDSRPDIRTARFYSSLDHVQVHDSLTVFTTGGIHGAGLSSDLVQLAVTNVAPTARFTVSAQPTVNQAVNFNGSTSTDADGTIVSYAWAFGDGTSASGVTTAHTYTAAGSYTATLVVTDNQGAYSSRAIAVTVAAANPTPPTTTTGRLPDTGITANQCYAAGSDTLVSCTSAAAIALNSQQDGMVGRDVTSPSAADGKLGFSYSLVPNQAGIAGLSYSKNECVKDTITGLTWEGKTANNDARDYRNTYSFYDSTSSAQFLNRAVYVNPTQAQIDASTNSVGYKNYVNSLALCGYSDWRLPTANELQSIVDYGVANPGPTIDTNWFVNTRASFYWAASPFLVNSGFAWLVDFYTGAEGNGSRSFPHYVRLVR